MYFFGIIAVFIVLGVVIAAVAFGQSKTYQVNEAASVYDFTIKANDDTDYPLAQHAGKLLLLVNTASRCGFTSQYEGLQELYTTYKDRGLTVLAIPSNDFLGQEPGTNEEIASFCRLNYGISFPLMAKVSVKGESQHPLYRYLTEQSHFPGPVTWNFNKFLIGPEGKVIARFGSRTQPKEMVAAIESALAVQKP